MNWIPAVGDEFILGNEAFIIIEVAYNHKWVEAKRKGDGVFSQKYTFAFELLYHASQYIGWNILGYV